MHSRNLAMEAAESRPWSDLQPELLGLVLKRLPSLADRVRLRAVCHPWRSNSMLQTLPLPFPWLSLPDGTFLSIPGGEVHRLAVPDGASCQGSIDNWLFIMSSDDTCTLMNPFSKTTLELPNLVTVWQRMVLSECDRKQNMYKVVAPSALDLSPGSLVAALIVDDGSNRTLCISQPPIVTYSVRGNRQPLQHLWDVAFFGGKLYAVSVFCKLFILEFRENLGSNPNIKSIIDSLGDSRRSPECIPRHETCTYRLYLVESGGRLLMVERFIRFMGPCSLGNVFANTLTAGFRVHEADLHSNPCRWRLVSDLDGNALFVGQHGSKSVPATEHSGYQEDCIYFLCDYPMPKYSVNPLRDAGIYNMRNGTITPLSSGITPAMPPRHAGQWRPAWFFPPETV